MSDDEIRDHDLEILKKASQGLIQHFDTVQIFVTRHEGEGTVRGNWGNGNWYARFGQVSLWVKDETTSHLKADDAEED